RRRIRLGDLHRRQHPAGVGDHPAHHRQQARAVRLRRRHRRGPGHADLLLRHAAARQPAAGLERAPYREDPPMNTQALAGAPAAILAPPVKNGTRFERNLATREAPWARRAVLAAALLFFAAFLLLPLAAVFFEALRRGWDTYLAA